MKVLSLRTLSVLTSAHKKTVELGLVIGAPGRDISQENALDHVAGYSQSSTQQSSHLLIFISPCRRHDGKERPRGRKV